MKHRRTNLCVKPSGSVLGATLERGRVAFGTGIQAAATEVTTDFAVKESGSWGEPLKKANSLGTLIGTLSWLPDMDLNHDKQIQSLLCYRYTIGQSIGRPR
jgi:hypothetical protein